MVPRDVVFPGDEGNTENDESPASGAFEDNQSRYSPANSV